MYSSPYLGQEEGFDGSALITVTPQYLSDRCGISSPLVVKRIIEWVEHDLTDFEEYIDDMPQPDPRKL